MNNKTVFFEQALKIAVEEIEKASLSGIKKITVVRDIKGRIMLMFPGKRETHKKSIKSIEQLCRDIASRLGNYGCAPEKMLLFKDELFISESELADTTILSDVVGRKISLLDRQITGQDWLKPAIPRKGASQKPRVAFFGIKGGVGRSTALIIWAWRLAGLGKKVLIFDLDLESPGVSSTLLPEKFLPDFGITDWFVEDGVGQGENVEKEMTATSPLSQGLKGEIRVIPAYGNKTNEYLPKLARCYANIVGKGTESWTDRLERLVSGREDNEKPDLIIFDTRAGIHDIAAASVTRMSSFAFLFAVDSPQTWKAYSFLFRNWKRHPQLASVRERMQIVASMIPETERNDHMSRFLEHSWDLFREELYDEDSPETPEDAFSFDLHDDTAPHYPLPVFWHRALQEFNPCEEGNDMDNKTASEAMGDFMKKAWPRIQYEDEERGQ